MFIYKLFHLQLMCETPEAGGGGVATAPAPGGVQPADPGQGAPPQGSDGFWSMFPNVPQEQQPILEPHLRGVQGEITRLQQQQAAFKPLTEAGYEPQQLQGLVQFDQRFQSDPTGVWMDMAKMLQSNGVIDEALDLEAVLAIAQGQEIEEEVPAPEGELAPEVQAYISRLEAQIEEIKGGIQQDRTRQSELVQDRLLNTQKGKMRETLQKAGYTAEELTDERLNSFIITHRGNITQATEDLVNMRNGILKQFTTNRPTPDPLETRNGGPNAPRPPVSNRDKGDPFATARPRAMNRLQRANRDAAQG